MRRRTVARTGHLVGRPGRYAGRNASTVARVPKHIWPRTRDRRAILTRAARDLRKAADRRRDRDGERGADPDGAGKADREIHKQCDDVPREDPLSSVPLSSTHLEEVAAAVPPFLRPM